jgi:hypothetical protein
MSSRSFWLSVVLACAGAGIATGQLFAAPPTTACGLVTPSELEAVVGSTVALKESNAGDVQMCVGQAAQVRVMLRLFTRNNDPSGEKEKAGLAAFRQMGAHVDVQTFGPITCSAVAPPPSLAEHGFTTTCSVRKASMFAVIEVNAKTQKDTVSIEKLKTLAEKMAARF